MSTVDETAVNAETVANTARSAELADDSSLVAVQTDVAKSPRSKKSTSSASNRQRREDPPDVKISKTLSYILRHGAAKEGLKMRSDGYIMVDDLLKRPKLKGVDVDMLRRLVATNEKQRYALTEEPNPLYHGQTILWIRANQGHSLGVENLEMQQLTSSDQCPVVVHGTFRRFWPTIQKDGLKVMNRHHIHCAAGLYGQEGITSGMRASCDVYIYIDMQKAMADGVSFERSANGVILTKGKDGVLAPEYFKEVKSKSGEILQ